MAKGSRDQSMLSHRDMIKELNNNYDIIRFVEAWVLRPMKSTKRKAFDTTQLTTESALQKLKMEIERTNCEVQSLLVLFDNILGYRFLRAPNESILRENPNRCQPPRILIRYQLPEASCKYDPSLGIRCSDWRKCPPANSLEGLTELKPPMTLEGIRYHCEAVPDVLTRWVSCSDDVSWVLRVLNKKQPSTALISIVDTAKLDLLEIPWARSNWLVKHFGGKCQRFPGDGGIKFAWPRHYLVYGWIPDQCVVATFDLTTFREACAKHKAVAKDAVIIDPGILVEQDPKPDTISSLADALEHSKL